MADRFDELLGPKKATQLRVELQRLFPKRSLFPPGCLYACAEPEFVGRIPVRSDLPVSPAEIRAEFQRLIDAIDLEPLLMDVARKLDQR